jgi:pentatricopeptide repeat protein
VLYPREYAAAAQREDDAAERAEPPAIDVHRLSSANVLDSRASVYVANEQPRQAIRDLTAAVADAPSAGLYLRLAFAYCLDGQVHQARKVFAEAQRRGLQRDKLHLPDRPVLEAVESALN